MTDAASTDTTMHILVESDELTRGVAVMVRISHVVPTLLATGAAVVALTSPAFAEGSWDSTFSGIVPGFDTRNWADANNDSTQTSLTIKSCHQDSGNYFTSLLWQLRRNRTAQPDEDMGSHNIDCRSSAGATVTYGDVKSGTYHFKYVSANGATSYWYSASYIGVKY